MITMSRSAVILRLLLLVAMKRMNVVASSEDYGSLVCNPERSSLVLKSEKKLVDMGLEPPTVTIPRQLCKLSFPPATCAKHEPNVVMPTADAIAALATPKPLVLIMKLGVGSPFAGDRKQILTKLVADCTAHGGVQLVLLIDRSEWTKSDAYNEASEALPSVLKPLVVGYSISDVQRLFPTKSLKPRTETPYNARARAIGKYYETASWSWWWVKHGKGASVAASRVWVVEDDTVFTGSWASLLSTMEKGLGGMEAQNKAADLISFRDYCTPEKSWIWARYMHEGWSNLTAPGLGLETWMTAYGLSPKYLDFIAETQRKGTTGHIEWFPATLALRNNFGLVFVQHDLRGKKLGHACNGGGEKRGGTFNYCCQGGNTVDGENWFEGWKATGECLGPTLLHPVKGDACGRFSANGFGRGCWRRQMVKNKTSLYTDVFEAGFVDHKTHNLFHPYSAQELARTL